MHRMQSELPIVGPWGNANRLASQYRRRTIRRPPYLCPKARSRVPCQYGKRHPVGRDRNHDDSDATQALRVETAPVPGDSIPVVRDKFCEGQVNALADFRMSCAPETSVVERAVAVPALTKLLRVTGSRFFTQPNWKSSPNVSGHSAATMTPSDEPSRVPRHRSAQLTFAAESRLWG